MHQIGMLTHSIQYDNNLKKSQFKDEYASLVRQRRDAAMINDAQAVEDHDKAIQKLFNDYGNLLPCRKLIVLLVLC